MGHVASGSHLTITTMSTPKWTNLGMGGNDLGDGTKGPPSYPVAMIRGDGETGVHSGGMNEPGEYHVHMTPVSHTVQVDPATGAKSFRTEMQLNKMRPLDANPVGGVVNRKNPDVMKMKMDAKVSALLKDRAKAGATTPVSMP